MAWLRDRVRAVLQNPRAMRTLDKTTALTFRATAAPYALFAHIGPVRMPVSRQTFRQMGFYPVIDHYYEPMINDAHLSRPLSQVRDLPGIDWRQEQQRRLLDELTFADELTSQRLDRAPVRPTDPYIGPLSNFDSGDAEFLYQMIRRFRPRRVFEIGSGDSTKIARLAIARNTAEDGVPVDHVCIEPYEMPWLELLGIRVIRSKVEDVDVAFFDQLEAGDLLFIDSSHVIRPQGDVLFEYLQVLPRLASGVLVHIHDIFSPRDYPQQWIHEAVRMWNEQYLVEALITDSDRYEIVAALNYLHHLDGHPLEAVCPYLTAQREPASLYLRVR